jgi:hypothetical protein
MYAIGLYSRSQGPRGLRRMSAVAWLLDSGLESRSGHGCLSLVLFCVGRGLCDGLIARPEESYRVSYCMCVIKKPRKGRPKVHPGL